MASLFEEAWDYVVDTFTGGKRTTDTSAEDIEKAGEQYRADVEDIVKNTKSAKDLYSEGKDVASAAANNKAGLAMRNAKAASMMNSGSKLMSAIQGAQAATDAATEGYDTSAANAANLASGIQANKNAQLQSAAQGRLETATNAAQMRAKQAQERANNDKRNLASLGAAFIQGLGE